MILRVLLIILLVNTLVAKKSNDSNLLKNEWWMRTWNKDSLPGISLNAAFHNNNLPKQNTDTIIIAVLDSDFDTKHKDLKEYFWVNQNEISNNSLDDDSNGYVDDKYGWNFLGIKGQKKALTFTLMDETRILSKYSEEAFGNLKEEKGLPFTFEEVKKSYDSIISEIKQDIEYNNQIIQGYSKTIEMLELKPNDSVIDFSTINSDNIENESLQQWVEYLSYLFDESYNYTDVLHDLKISEKCLEICMNLNYDNRELVGDNYTNFLNINYGNSYFNQNSRFLEHGTAISGVISSILQFQKNNGNTLIKIMPITITGIGDFTDKNLSLGIRYAVDNGAKIINISQGKKFSIQEDFVDDALKYAETHDVLIVNSAGNENENADDIIKYPNDVNNKDKEIVNNFIVVGGSTKSINKNLREGDSRV
ncbi:S8 family serine peptidase [Aquimarina sp. ERC-38]|uniref:S8 family serine peptidase n=1 Tax=Aquimarina sp. ERC-38 TaxID=2949996 RepID=UPI002246FF0E|nr:S8 family serine peptidase [Aquimarina sp. ERC-38]UZO81709.1 S8 family serine peptidase [Aquimarina sp. ERC-38]